MAVDFDLTKKTIHRILSGVNEGSAFAYASNLTVCPNPGLDIHGLGVLGLPLSNHDAEAIVSKAKQSPFGHRETTIVDTLVRRSWELDPTQFTLRNPSWHIQLHSMIAAVHSALKLKCDLGCVSAELYKLLLYEPGAFFKPHRDSEKTPGMFGTLIVCLPSPHEGGDLLLTHNGSKFEHKTATMSDFNFSYAAWYSDITHQVQEVTSGHRLVLTYNLVRRDSTSSIPLRINSTTTLESLLKEELEDYNTLLHQEDNEVPKFLVYKLDQKYTQASLKADRLGTQDHDRVQLLHKVAQQLDFEVWLGTLERLFISDEDDETLHDLQHEDIKHIVDLEGNHILETVTLLEDSLIGPVTDGRDDYDESEHEGYTGNEGAPINYWYRDTIAIIIPKRNKVQLWFDNTREESQLVKLLRGLRAKAITDGENTADLLRFCQLAINQPSVKTIFGSMITDPRKHILAQEALWTLLEWDAFDEFVKTVEKAEIKDLFRCGEKLGDAIIRNGFQKLKAGLDSVFQKTLKALQSQNLILNDVLETVRRDNSTNQEDTIVLIEQWRSEQTTRNLHLIKPETAADGRLLAGIAEHNSEQNSWMSLSSIVRSSPFPARIAFVNTLFRKGSQFDLQGHIDFLQNILDTIWQQFTFAKMTKQGGHQDARFDRFLRSPPKDPELTLDDFVETVNSSLSPSCGLGRTQICNILISKGLDACETNQLDLMTEFLGRIRKHRVPALLDIEQPPPECQELFTSFLAKYITGTLGVEPQPPPDWKRETQDCPRNCNDCVEVNAFLKDKTLITHDMRVPLSNRKHLSSVYDSPYTKQKCWCVDIIKTRSPHFWRITKDNSLYSKNHARWTKNKSKVIATLRSLERAGPQWHAFLGPHFNPIMSGLAENVQHILRTPLSERQPSTRTKQVESGVKRHAEDDENNVENKRTRIEQPEVIDLTS